MSIHSLPYRLGRGIFSRSVPAAILERVGWIPHRDKSRGVSKICFGDF